MEQHFIQHDRDPLMWVWIGPNAKDDLDDEWEAVYRPRCIYVFQGVAIDQDLRMDDMLHDAFATPNVGDELDQRPILDGQGGAKLGTMDGPTNVGTATKFKGAIAHDVRQACAMVDEVGHEPQKMDEIGNAIHGDGVETHIGGMERDQRSSSISGTLNLLRGLDGIASALHMGGYNVIPNVVDLNDVRCPLYPRARCSNLFGTFILMNIYTIHSGSNKFMDELFSFLHKFILLI